MTGSIPSDSNINFTNHMRYLQKQIPNLYMERTEARIIRVIGWPFSVYLIAKQCSCLKLLN